MEDVLILFKLDLGISSTSKDKYFNNLLLSIKSELERKGFALCYDCPEDIMLITDYAVWRYKNKDADLPKNIQKRITDRVVQQRSKNG